jgi:hypothetical protein
MIASIVGGLFGILFLLLGAAIGLAGFAFWLWMLVHAITNKGVTDGEKIVWVLVIIFLPFIGSIVYFFIGRPKGTSAGLG